MLATVVADITEFERGLIRERVRSDLATAKAQGKRLGRHPGPQPNSGRFASKVFALVAQGRSYRPIGCEVRLSKNTVTGITRRSRTAAQHDLMPGPAPGGPPRADR